jgi:hypothetical protein
MGQPASQRNQNFVMPENQGFGGGWGSYKKGGRVKKTGPAIVHKGEYVLPAGVVPTQNQLRKMKRKRK